jgi:hypothetical protein
MSASFLTPRQELAALIAEATARGLTVKGPTSGSRGTLRLREIGATQRATIHRPEAVTRPTIRYFNW